MSNIQSSPLASPDTFVDETSVTGGLTAEMGKPKAGTLGIAGKFNLGPDQTSEILRNMQAELDKRTGPMSTFLGGLQRASAWGSGGAQGPAAALTAMDREELLKSQDTQAMIQKMAGIKGAEATRQAKIQSYGGMPGQFAQAGGEGATAQPGATTKAMSPIQGMIMSLPSAQQPIAMNAWRSGDVDTIESMVVANEKNRTTEAKNLDLLNSLPAGDQRDMIKAQAFKDAVANRTMITKEGEIPFTPSYAPRPPGMGGAAPATGSGVNQFNVGNVRPAGASTGFQQPGDYAEGLTILDKNLKSYGDKGINTLSGVINRWAPPKDEKGNVINDTNAYIKAASSRLGISPDQQIDLSNPAQRQAIGTAIMLQEKGPKGIFATAPISTANAELAANATAPTESVGQFSTQSKEGKDLAIAGIKGDNESIIKEIQNPMLAKVAAEKDLPQQITRTLDILDKTKVGPGASTAMLVSELKGFFGDLKPEELQQLINQKTVNQTQASIVAGGIKAAFGAQLSDKEGDRYIKTLFTLDDPRQFVRASLELKRAAVYSNKDFANYLIGKPDKAKAIRDYEAISDQRNNEILKKHAPTVYAQMQKAQTEKPAAEKPAATPAISNSAAETWLKANPNHPDAPAVRKKLGL